MELIVGETRSKMEGLSEQTGKHAKTINDLIQKEMNRMEKIASTLEKYTTTQVGEAKGMITNHNEIFEKWRANIEDMESSKFLEVHSALKILNSNSSKLHRDSKDRFELLQKEFLSLDDSLRCQLKDLRHKVEVDLQSIEERTLMVIDKQYQIQTAGTTNVGNEYGG